MNFIEPLYHAVAFNNQFAINTYINKFGLEPHQIQELNKHAFENVLNSQVTEKVDEVSFKVTKMEIDYGFLDGEKYENKSCMESLKYISDHDHFKHLILHPVLSFYIDKQFKRLNRLFSYNFLIFLCFGALAVLLNKPIVMGFYLLFRELIQIILAYRAENLKEYFTSLTNLFDILLIVGVFVMPLSFKEESIIIVTFLGLIQSIMIISELKSSFALKMFILLKIVGKFVKLFVIVLPIILSFGIGFHLIFKGCEKAKELNKFETYFTSVVKTVVMTVASELDFKDFCKLNSAFVRIFFIFFLLCSIVLINFVSALVIADIEVRMIQIVLKLLNA